MDQELAHFSTLFPARNFFSDLTILFELSTAELFDCETSTGPAVLVSNFGTL